ncbi:hypothetical protein BV22DRAFT_1023485 [Leucogyrophana mollusca]|uniref:Uncharacterized protein n=1 Tax=Leucogyrophana mollusca TaxID=85980 RepID=A0ACB8B2S2_9AGAM|nr:hypothetical protein BV22DRAFT_1023485 [Leucogyrophana mollusca]
MREGQRPRVLRYHLGDLKDHTVYEAEVVGLTLAAQLLATEPNLTFPASIYVDNQAAIRSGETITAKAGHHLVDHFHRQAWELKRAHDDYALTVRWISGHDGVEGNERADREAKKAAGGKEQNSRRTLLPTSHE